MVLFLRNIHVDGRLVGLVLFGELTLYVGVCVCVCVWSSVCSSLFVVSFTESQNIEYKKKRKTNNGHEVVGKSILD